MHLQVHVYDCLAFSCRVCSSVSQIKLLLQSRNIWQRKYPRATQKLPRQWHWGAAHLAGGQTKGESRDSSHFTSWQGGRRLQEIHIARRMKYREPGRSIGTALHTKTQGAMAGNTSATTSGQPRSARVISYLLSFQVQRMIGQTATWTTAT